jgi:hypothetical protein
VAEDEINIGRELQVLESELKRLENEYNMYFAGRLARPPLETRARVTGMVRRIDNMRINNYGERFRFETIQSRFSSLVELWDRALKAREEGRPGPFMQPRPMAAREAPRKADHVLKVTTFSDPAREIEKVRELYDTLTEARREVGEEAIPFNKFADLVTKQVGSFREKGSGEVAFRVAVKDGKVAFTARAMRGDGDSDGG